MVFNGSITDLTGSCSKKNACNVEIYNGYHTFVHDFQLMVHFTMD